MPKFLWAISARYSATIVQFAISVMIAHQLSPTSMGIYLGIFGLITSASVLAGLGAADGIVRVYPEVFAAEGCEEADHLCASYLRFGSWTSFALAVALGGLAGVVSGEASLIAPASLWAAGYLLTTVGSQALVSIGRSNIGTFLYYGSSNWFSLVAVTACFMLPGRADLVQVGWAVALGSFAAGASCLFIAQRSVCRPSRAIRPSASIVNIIRVGMPMTLVRLAQSALIWSPVWIAGAFFGANNAAVVGLASRLVVSVGAAVAALRFASRPQLVALTLRGEWSEVESIGRAMAHFCGLLSAVVFIGNLALGRFIWPVIFGREYKDVWIAIALLLVGVIIESAAGPSDEILKLTGAAGLVLSTQLAVLVAGVISQCALGALGTPRLVLLAASISFGGLYVYYGFIVAKRHNITPFVLGSVCAKWVRSQSMRSDSGAPV